MNRMKQNEVQLSLVREIILLPARVPHRQSVSVVLIAP